jgi:hypothetical protein
MKLLQLSRDRTKTWKDTLAGKRQQRVLQRQQRQQDEEAERCRVDAEFAAENAKLRQEVIDRAHRLQTNNKDHVKQLHSEILNEIVLKACRLFAFRNDYD